MLKYFNLTAAVFLRVEVEFEVSLLRYLIFKMGEILGFVLSVDLEKDIKSCNNQQKYVINN